MSDKWFYIPPNISEAYKFFSGEDEQYANSMVERGELQIGTLNYYRTVESKNLERSDSGEGTKKVFTDEKRRYYTTEELPPQIQGSINIVSGTLDNSAGHKISVNQSIDDCYIYCVSESMSQWNISKYGPACVKIFNPTAFFLEIDKSFRAHRSGSLVTGGFSVQKCVYDDREQRYDRDQGVSPAFLKPRNFSEDFEVRAVWQPTTLPIQKIIISCQGIRKYCMRIQ